MEEHEDIEKAQVITVPADFKQAPDGEEIKSYVPGF